MSNWTPGGGEESDSTANAKVYGYGHNRLLKEVVPVLDLSDGAEETEIVLVDPYHNPKEVKLPKGTFDKMFEDDEEEDDGF